MWKSGGLRVALAGVVAVVLAGGMAVEPAWAAVGDCDNGTTQRVTGTINNVLDGPGSPYYPGCSALAFDSVFNAFAGTCDTPTSYLVDLSATNGGPPVDGSILIIITWNPGPNGTPPNQPETFVFDSGTSDGYLNATESTCVQNFTANSGPLAVTLNSLSATESSGGRASLALAALSLVAAAVMIGRRRLGKHAPDA
jgi:hypothetical protein